MAYLTDGSGNRLTSDDGLDLLTDGSAGGGGGGSHDVGLVTCLGLSGYGVGRRTAIFGGKGGGPSGPHAVGIVSRLGLDGYGLRRYRSFSGKPNADQGPHTVAEITRLALDGYGVRRAGSFAGKGAPGGPHAVSRITRLGLDGYGVKRAGSFAGRTSPSSHPVGLITRLGLDGYGQRRYRTFAGKTPSVVVVVPPVVTPPIREVTWPVGYRDKKRKRETDDERRLRVFTEMVGSLEEAAALIGVELPKAKAAKIAEQAEVALEDDSEWLDLLELLRQIQFYEDDTQKILAERRAALKRAYEIQAEMRALILRRRRDDEDAILVMLLS